MFLHNVLVKNKKIDNFSIHPLHQKFLLGLLRIKLVIVNTTKFRLILGMLKGYKY